LTPNNITDILKAVLVGAGIDGLVRQHLGAIELGHQTMRAWDRIILLVLQISA